MYNERSNACIRHLKFVSAGRTNMEYMMKRKSDIRPIRFGHVTYAMTDFVRFLLQQFWIIVIIVIAANAIIWRFQARDRIAADPSLRTPLNRLTRASI